jgi:hypothetical protein
MIQSRTARKMMYDWHGGQSCPLYAAASSGLVADTKSLTSAALRVSVRSSGATHGRMLLSG